MQSLVGPSISPITRPIKSNELQLLVLLSNWYFSSAGSGVVPACFWTLFWTAHEAECNEIIIIIIIII